MSTFIGFSTIANGTNRSWVLTDRDLIKRDMLNHFHTRIGERVMRPTFGCRLWDWIYEPLTPTMIEMCRAEVERIVLLDSRVETRSISVTSSQYGIMVSVDIYYRPFDMVENMRISFEERQN